MTQAEMLERRQNAKPSRYLAMMNATSNCSLCGKKLNRYPSIKIKAYLENKPLYCSKVCANESKRVWTDEDIEMLKRLVAENKKGKEVLDCFPEKQAQQVYDKMYKIKKR